MRRAHRLTLLRPSGSKVPSLLTQIVSNSLSFSSDDLQMTVNLKFSELNMV